MRRLLDSSLTVVETNFWPFVSDAAYPVVDPRTGELWGVRGNGQYWEVIHFAIQNGYLYPGQRIRLPQFVGNKHRFEIDEDGRLHIAEDDCVQVVDLDTMQTQVIPMVGIYSWSYTPPRGGRPAMAIGWELPGAFVSGDWIVASLDSSGFVSQVFHREPHGAINGDHQNQIITTRTGRTFITRGDEGNCPWFAEVDYSGGGLIPWSVLSYGVDTLQEDPARNLLYLYGYFPLPQGGRDWHAIFDLSTNQITRTTTGGIGFNRWFKSYHPRDQLTPFPLEPPSGSALTAHLTLGGHPGELGLIYLKHAELGGLPVHGLETIVSLGTLGPAGVHHLALPYSSARFPMQPGDALFFEGFLFDGLTIRSSGESAMRWR